MLDIVWRSQISFHHFQYAPEMGGAKIYFLSIVHCLRTERAARSVMTTKSSLFHFFLKPGAFQNRWPHFVLERSESFTKGQLAYILDEVFSVLSGHACHFGLIYWIKSSYNVVRIIHNSISDNRNALNKTIYRYDVTRYCGRDDVILSGDRYDVTQLSSSGDWRTAC